METGTIGSNDRILKSLFRDAFLVICLMELLNSVASITDSWFIGHWFGSDGMAAMGFARPFFSYVDILCGPFGLGTQLVCSHCIGKCEMNRAQKVFSGALFLALVLSVLLGAIGLHVPSGIAWLHGAGSATAEVQHLTADYLKGLFWGVPAMIGFGVLSPIVQLGGSKKLITAGVIAQIATDIFGNVLSVFVFHGEMYGLGLATAASYYAAVIPLVIYFFRQNALLRLRPEIHPLSVFREIFPAGASKAIKRVCNTAKPFILNALSLLLGTTLAVSAYSVTNQIRDLLISFSAGVSGAMILIGAVLYGQRDRDGLRYLTKLSLRAIGMISGLGMLCVLFATPIVRFFISDSEEVIRMASVSVRCVGIMIPFATFNGIIIACMQITRRFRPVRILSFLNRLILIVITSAVMGWVFGTDGLWWAMPVSEILNAIISMLLIRRLNGRFPKSAAELLCLNHNFGYQPENYIEISLNGLDDVVTLLANTEAFCMNHDIDQRRSYFTQLALEELTVNVLQHGFPKCRHKAALHVWITCDDGEIRIHIQDNCPGFNVMQYCSHLQEQHTERCVGLRLVSRIAKDMNYINSLGTNNVIITI